MYNTATMYMYVVLLHFSDHYGYYQSVGIDIIIIVNTPQ